MMKEERLEAESTGAEQPPPVPPYPEYDEELKKLKRELTRASGTLEQSIKEGAKLKTDWLHLETRKTGAAQLYEKYGSDPYMGDELPKLMAVGTGREQIDRRLAAIADRVARQGAVVKQLSDIQTLYSILPHMRERVKSYEDAEQLGLIPSYFTAENKDLVRRLIIKLHEKVPSAQEVIKFLTTPAIATPIGLHLLSRQELAKRWGRQQIPIKPAGMTDADMLEALSAAGVESEEADKIVKSQAEYLENYRTSQLEFKKWMAEVKAGIPIDLTFGQTLQMLLTQPFYAFSEAFGVYRRYVSVPSATTVILAGAELLGSRENSALYEANRQAWLARTDEDKSKVMMEAWEKWERSGWIKFPAEAVIDPINLLGFYIVPKSVALIPKVGRLVSPILLSLERNIVEFLALPLTGAFKAIKAAIPKTPTSEAVHWASNFAKSMQQASIAIDRVSLGSRTDVEFAKMGEAALALSQTAGADLGDLAIERMAWFMRAFKAISSGEASNLIERLTGAVGVPLRVLSVSEVAELNKLYSLLRYKAVPLDEIVRPILDSLRILQDDTTTAIVKEFLVSRIVKDNNVWSVIFNPKLAIKIQYGRAINTLKDIVLNNITSDVSTYYSSTGKAVALLAARGIDRFIFHPITMTADKIVSGAANWYLKFLSYAPFNWGETLMRAYLGAGGIFMKRGASNIDEALYMLQGLYNQPTDFARYGAELAATTPLGLRQLTQEGKIPLITKAIPINIAGMKLNLGYSAWEASFNKLQASIRAGYMILVFQQELRTVARPQLAAIDKIIKTHNITKEKFLGLDGAEVAALDRYIRYASTVKPQAVANLVKDIVEFRRATATNRISQALNSMQAVPQEVRDTMLRNAEQLLENPDQFIQQTATFAREQFIGKSKDVAAVFRVLVDEIVALPPQATAELYNQLHQTGNIVATMEGQLTNIASEGTIGGIGLTDEARHTIYERAHTTIQDVLASMEDSYRYLISHFQASLATTEPPIDWGRIKWTVDETVNRRFLPTDWEDIVKAMTEEFPYDIKYRVKAIRIANILEAFGASGQYDLVRQTILIDPAYILERHTWAHEFRHSVDSLRVFQGDREYFQAAIRAFQKAAEGTPLVVDWKVASAEVDAFFQVAFPQIVASNEMDKLFLKFYHYTERMANLVETLAEFNERYFTAFSGRRVGLTGEALTEFLDFVPRHKDAWLIPAGGDRNELIRFYQRYVPMKRQPLPLTDDERNFVNQFITLTQQRLSAMEVARNNSQQIFNEMKPRMPARNREAWWREFFQRRAYEYANFEIKAQDTNRIMAHLNELRLKDRAGEYIYDTVREIKTFFQARGVRPVITLQDVAKLFSTQADSITSNFIDILTGTIMGREYFVNTVLNRANAVAQVHLGTTAERLGFTRQTVSDLYDRILLELGIAPGTEAPLTPIMAELENFRKEVHGIKTGMALHPDDYQKVRSYLDKITHELEQLDIYGGETSTGLEKATLELKPEAVPVAAPEPLAPPVRPTIPVDRIQLKLTFRRYLEAEGVETDFVLADSIIDIVIGGGDAGRGRDELLRLIRASPGMENLQVQSLAEPLALLESGNILWQKRDIWRVVTTISKKVEDASSAIIRLIGQGVNQQNDIIRELGKLGVSVPDSITAISFLEMDGTITIKGTTLKLTGKAPPVRPPVPPTAPVARAVPAGWSTAVDPNFKRTPGWRGEVDWKDKRIVFETVVDSQDIGVINHEIAHILIEDVVGLGIVKLSDSPLLEAYARITQELDLHPNLVREHLAIDYGQFLTDPTGLNPEIVSLLRKNFPEVPFATPPGAPPVRPTAEPPPAAPPVEPTAPPVAAPTVSTSFGNVAKRVRPDIPPGMSKELFNSLKTLGANPHPGQGWKMHLNIDEDKWDTVSQWLTNNKDKYDYLWKGGKTGAVDEKSYTIYVGSKNNANVMAKVLDAELGKVINPPVGDILADDIMLFKNVWGRFEISHSPGWHQYGKAGLPFLRDDMEKIMLARMEKKSVEEIRKISDEAFAKAEKKLAAEWKEYFTGGAPTAPVEPLVEPPTAVVVAPPIPPVALEEISMVSGADRRWWQLKEEAAKRARQRYEMDFTQYTPGDMVDTVGHFIHPFWSYESQRWLWLPRNLVGRPAMGLHLTQYLDYTDGGYIRVPFTPFQINLFRGSIFMGALRRLWMRDYPEYRDLLPGVHGTLDFIARWGFFPGIHFTIPAMLIGTKDPNTRWAFGEIYPAFIRDTLDVITLLLPGKASLTFRETVAPEPYRDYLTLLEYNDMFPKENGLLVWTKRREGIQLEEEEETRWVSASKRAAWHNILFDQTALLRLRPKDQEKAYDALNEMMSQLTGVPVPAIKRIRELQYVTGTRLSDTITLDPVKQQLLRDLEAMQRWIRTTMPIQPSAHQVLDRKITLFWKNNDEMTESAKERGVFDRQGRLIHPSYQQIEDDWKEGRIDFEGMRRKNSELAQYLMAARVELAKSPYFRDVPLTLKERTDYFEKKGWQPPIFHPLQEMLWSYYDITVPLKRDEQTGKTIQDYETYYDMIDAFFSSLPPEEKAIITQRIQMNWTDMRKLDWNKRQELFRPYNAIRQAVLQTYTPEQQVAIKKFSMADELEAKQLQEITLPDGSKLISNFSQRVTLAHQNLRRLNPELDAWLLFTGRVDKPMTDKARNIYTGLETKYRPNYVQTLLTKPE